ncbi:MAG: SIS domain-containing protein [Planctomycetes bacterium]|nr:SIS domain-containing protein [Planctomycetota bacterium]
MSNEQLINKRIEQSIAAISSLRDCSSQIATITDVICQCLKAGGTLYTAGNGGSAAQALHLAEELIGRYRGDRPPQRAICLCADTPALTCIANDYGFENIFSRQVKALATENDIVLVLSTSGNSPNIVNALQTARDNNATTIGLLGNDGGNCTELCDHSIIIPGEDSAHTQEAHQVVIHLICEVVEQYCAQASTSPH